MTSAYEAFPLHWPEGWLRTPNDRRKHSNYKVSFGKARDDLLVELRLFDVQPHSIVVSTNVPLRGDGLPYAQSREPKDPGVAVYWTTKASSMLHAGEARVIACDSWRTVRENLRAVGLAVQGLRLIERTQASEILRRAYTGFAALPAAGSGTLPNWASTLGFSTVIGLTMTDIEDAYKRAVFKAHPDHGGNHDAMVQLNQALDDARRFVSTARHNGAS